MKLTVVIFDGLTTLDAVGGYEVLSRIPGMEVEFAAPEAGIPGVIVQGRYDLCTPAVTAFDLHRAWPQAELVVAPHAGHAWTEPETTDALVAATDRFAGR